MVIDWHMPLALKWGGPCDWPALMCPAAEQKCVSGRGGCDLIRIGRSTAEQKYVLGCGGCNLILIRRHWSEASCRSVADECQKGNARSEDGDV